MGRRESVMYGKDVTIKMRLTFLEAVHGCKKELKYDIGASQQRNKRGKPKPESKTRTVDVEIPAGVDSVRCIFDTYLIASNLLWLTQYAFIMLLQTTECHCYSKLRRAEQSLHLFSFSSPSFLII